MTKETPIPVIDSRLAPEDITGGVWVQVEQAFVPVHPTQPIEIEWDGSTFTIQEYADEEGRVRASLLDIPAGGMTPAWYIKQEPDTYDYMEVHQIVSGRGTMIVKPREGDNTKSGWSTNEKGESVFDVRSGMHPLEAGQIPNLRVQPGETFQVLADQGEPVQVLATFPDKPFSLEFEERVGSLL